MMKAVVITKPGGPEVLQLQDVPAPELKSNEVMIKIKAAGINGADKMQRHGQYPVPPGGSLYPGLEVSGTIEEVGKDVKGWKAGDEVCALLVGGGYAERVNVPAGQVFPIPKGVSLVDAAGLPEVSSTVWSVVFMAAKLQEGENFLIHGGSSGVGTFAIQLAKYKGAKVLVTAGSDEKLQACKELGADVAINYKSEDWVARVKHETGGKGADVILDVMGAPYLSKNTESLAPDGRLIVLGLQGGATGEINLAALLAKRATIFVLALRSRPLEQKAHIVDEVRRCVWPAIEAGEVKPIIDRTFELTDVVKAHEWVDSSGHIGKVLLLV